MIDALCRAHPSDVTGWNDVWPSILIDAIKYRVGSRRVGRVIRNLRDMPDFPAELLCAIGQWDDSMVSMLFRYAPTDWLSICPVPVLEAVAAIEDDDARNRLFCELLWHVASPLGAKLITKFDGHRRLTVTVSMPHGTSTFEGSHVHILSAASARRRAPTVTAKE